MVKETNLEIWVFGDHRNHPHDRLTFEVLGQARSLCGAQGRVTLILLGHQVEGIAKEYIARGAQRILMVDHPQLAFYREDLFTTIFCDLVKDQKPEILLLGASEFGKELAAGIAKRLETGLSADCISLDWDGKGQRLLASSPAFGGNFLARITWNAKRPYMATIKSGIFLERPFDKDAHGEIVRIEKDLNEASSKINLISSVREYHQAAKLEDRWEPPGPLWIPIGPRTNSSSGRQARRSNRSS
jgi:electron transfer flavoprotein alpha subunit